MQGIERYESTRGNVVTGGGEPDFTAIPDTLDLVLDYTCSRAVTEFDIETQIAGVEPLPDLEATPHSVGVRADYKATDDVTLRLGYRFETLDVEDFALDSVDEVVAPALFGLGNRSPDYEAHVVGLSTVMKS